MTRQLTERRLAYFFGTRRRWREEVQNMRDKLQEFGSVVIIGGMIRDLALEGNREFGSDVDFVVKPLDISRFESFMDQRAAKRNKFGGYNLQSAHWRIDVWPLQRTWASEAGYVNVETFPDLLKCTFFDVDAIIYDLQSKKLTCPQNYFTQLKRRELEINLRANPNPVGNAVRALRYAATRNFGWGPRLCEFVAAQIEEAGWDELKQREIQSFRTCHIAEMDQDKVQRELFLHLKSRREDIFRSEEWCHNKQRELQLRGSYQSMSGSSMSVD